MLTHFHWIVWVYRDFDPQSGNYVDITHVDVIALDHAAALKAAEKLIPKSVKGGGKQVGYRVQQVIEHIDGACK